MLYISRIPWIELLAGDMTVVQCLLLAAGIESCIRCGLIQSNTGYRALFEASTIRAEITDEALRVQAASVPHELFPAEKLREAAHRTTHLDRNPLLKGSPIRGGFVFWQEDISELQDALDRLRLVQDELRDTGRSLTAMLLFAEQSGGVLRARVSASCTESLDVLCSRFDGLTAEHDEDGLWHLTWALPEVTA